MSEAATNAQAAPQDDSGSSEVAAELERSIQRNAEPFLERMKQAILGAAEEAARKYGAALVAELRQTLQGAVNDLVATHVEKLVEQLRPGGETARRVAEGMLRDLREFINTTVRDLIAQQVPEYSRWAGRRVVDYAVTGVLFVVAAILLCVGGILALEEAGVPLYPVYLVAGSVALVIGFGLFMFRSQRWDTLPSGESRPPG